MERLNVSPLPLPLSTNGPPAGSGWDEREMSLSSATSAFETGIERRDTFLGQLCCIVCGEGQPLLEHCHIIGDSGFWSELKLRRWIPPQAKGHPCHEPRNGLLMCGSHHIMFKRYCFFIRFVPNIRKFVLINYSNRPYLRPWHGKAIALDIRDRHAPFPSLFIIHEMRVRGFHPFEPISPAISHDLSWQDWISSGGVVDDTTGSFNRAPLPNNASGNDNNSGPAQPQLPITTTGGGSPDGLMLELNSGVIAEILSVTRSMPSWKACQMEGTSWTGTAEENIEEYVSSIGVEHCQPP